MGSSIFAFCRYCSVFAKFQSKSLNPTSFSGGKGDPAKTPTPKEFPKLLQAKTISVRFKVLMLYLDLFSTIVSECQC